MSAGSDVRTDTPGLRDAAGVAGRMSPRTIVLGLLLASFAWALIIPLSLTSPPAAAWAVLFVAGLGVFGAALVLALWVAVGPAPSKRLSLSAVVVLVAASLALWLPLYSWAQAGEEPWAWLAGFAVAACALVDRWAGVVSAVVLGAAAAAGGAMFGGAVPANLLTVLGCAAAVWAMCQVLVWLLRLLRSAQAGRRAEAELAVAEERLRVSRELHDVLGHRLGVIALKAELAADLAARHPDRSAAESEGIRALATETLAEARRAVHGDTVADLAAQLDAAALVLGSAGIESTIDADRELVGRMPAATSRLLATVVREAVTNVLRHSDARHASISVTGMDAAPTLVIVNDGVPATGRSPGQPAGGTGLASLAARCAAAGARLSAGRDADGRFELRVDVGPGQAASP